MAGRLGVMLLALSGLTNAASFKTALERKLKMNTISHNEPGQPDTDPTLLYPAYNLSVPVDHFHNESRYEPHTNDKFNLRYWFDASYYKAGGPVIVLQSGETDGTARLPYLQKGLLHQMIQATHGIGVVLEHRYYGTSIPTPDLSTENLRFLTTEQALADEAYFAQNVVFEGLEHVNLKAPHTAYIGYGGSYAGAFNAFLRKVYPDVFWGTISSSGVTEAIYDYWEYYEPIRVYGPPTCISNVQKITHMVDNIITNPKNSGKVKELKTAFGLPNVTYNDDFASVLSFGVQGWQSKNWDPAVNDLSFDWFCANISSKSELYKHSSSLKSTVKDLLTVGGYGHEVSTLTVPVLNWIGWLYDNEVAPCASEGSSQDACFSTHIPEFYSQDDITQDWRSWPYQYCTEYGFLQTGSGVPANQLPLLSRTIDLAWSSIICVEAFNITTPPDTDRVNKYGGFDISYPRLAFIDGERDPWRPATPHAFPFNSTAHNRVSTIDEPFILIQGAVHHWDENGLFPNQTINKPFDLLPPLPIRTTQAEEITFLLAWMKEWKVKNGYHW
ncbi:serine carboxypeptidase S28-domain-containing protein [Xylogone sp. PMI_703]|nr:serine carboxypeptidase S28-domain-containing protein [Xylogone sp. PMI_703]